MSSQNSDIYIKLVTARMRSVWVMLMSFYDNSEFMEPYKAQKGKFSNPLLTRVVTV